MLGFSLHDPARKPEPMKLFSVLVVAGIFLGLVVITAKAGAAPRFAVDVVQF